MTIPLVDLRAQYRDIKDEIDSAISKVIEDAAFVGGKYVKEFEDAFADFCNVRHCVGVGNGTDALYLALKALGVGPGDEVITAANSFIATSEAITMTGAHVVFADCDSQTFNIDMEGIRKAITGNTKAIVPVHLYGQSAQMADLMRLAEERDLLVVEDAAQAHGAEFQEQRAGSFGHAATFSFYPGKNLGAYGDGGAIVTNDTGLANKIRMIANHGRLSKYDHEMEGVNSRLDGLQAAILGVKLNRLEDWNDKRRRIAELYDSLLADSPIITPSVIPDAKHVYHLYVIRVPRHRDIVRERLQENGIATGIHYPIPLPNLKAYRHQGHSPDDFPLATQYAGEILSLPIFPELKEEGIRMVCKNLKEIIASVDV